MPFCLFVQTLSDRRLVISEGTFLLSTVGVPRNQISAKVIKVNKIYKVEISLVKGKVRLLKTWLRFRESVNVTDSVSYILLLTLDTQDQ